MKAFICVLFFANFIAFSAATSSGIAVTCNVDENLGCVKWNRGIRSQCQDTPKPIMYWAAKPVRSGNFTLSASVIQYTPGQWMDVYLQVEHHAYKFRGLMLYAVDDNNNKVGEWEVTDGQYWKPWGDSPNDPCHQTILHLNAEFKTYKSTWRFKGPAKGTGKVTFKSIVKVGNANVGEFYFPGYTDFYLIENTQTPAADNWYLTDADESCDQFCRAKNYACDESKLDSVDGLTEFKKVVGPRFTCKLPFLETCEETAPGMSNNGYCYYYGTSCASRTDSCFKKGGYVSKRMCYCDPNQTPPPTTAPSGQPTVAPTVAASSRININIFVILAALFFGLRSNRLFFFIAVIALFSQGVFGHNWIETPSRSRQASTFAPCLPKQGSKPHVQVKAGQEFQIEWTSGHPGRVTYFVVLHESGAANMTSHYTKILEEYINDAPANAHADMSLGKNQRYLRTRGTTTAGNDLEAIVDANDNDYIPRPPQWGSTVYTQWRYKAADRANDKVVEYTNSKYPWIEKVYKFKISYHYPSFYDVTRFTISAKKGPGNYIVHYVWSGYRDCIDVNIQPNTVQNEYGVQQGQDTWVKVDHCFFEKPSRYRTGPYEVLTTPYEIIRRCNQQSYDQCGGITVAPNRPPKTTYPKFQGMEYADWNSTTGGMINHWLRRQGYPDDVVTGFGVTPRAETDTIPEMTIVSDPQDPYFYSTCYKRVKNIAFIGFKDEDEALPNNNWKFHDKCISCDNLAKNQIESRPSKFDVTDKCKNCDLHPAPPVPQPPMPAMLRNASLCDGLNNAWSSNNHHTCTPAKSCTKTLYPRFTNYNMRVEDCDVLAGRDSQCSDKFFWRSPGYCYCYLKDSCCKTCSSKSSSLYNIYRTTSAPAEIADPGCTKGTKSDDGKICCEASCNKCVANLGNLSGEDGLCTSIPSSVPVERQCDTHSAPCHI